MLHYISLRCPWTVDLTCNPGRLHQWDWGTAMLNAQLSTTSKAKQPESQAITRLARAVLNSISGKQTAKPHK